MCAAQTKKRLQFKYRNRNNLKINANLALDSPYLLRGNETNQEKALCPYPSQIYPTSEYGKVKCSR